MFCPKCGCEQEDGAKFCNKCGESILDEPAKKVKKSGGGKAKRALTVVTTLAALAIVVGVTVNMTQSFLSDMNGENTVNEDSPSGGSDSGQQSEQSSGSSEDAFGKEMAKLFAETYSCQWKVKKYSENGQTWATYDLGKKMIIAAFNFLNDWTTTTGGYNKVSGYTIEETPGKDTLCPECKAYPLSRQSFSSNYWVCGLCGYKKYYPPGSFTYEWVPSQTSVYHGEDIYYECPQITITPTTVDMRGMGGGVYSIDDFRYEVSSDGNDRIVNDQCKFALEYDGKYLNYKEPDAYGYYVGYYAYDTTDSLVNITYIHDRTEFYTY